MQPVFKYGAVRLRDVHIQTSRDEKLKRRKVAGIEIDGETVQPTHRFWASLSRRFGISNNMFQYFDPPEIVARVSERARDDLITYCIEYDGSNAKALAATAPSCVHTTYDEALKLVSGNGGQDIIYHDGVISSTHMPRSGD